MLAFTYVRVCDSEYLLQMHPCARVTHASTQCAVLDALHIVCVCHLSRRFTPEHTSDSCYLTCKRVFVCNLRHLPHRWACLPLCNFCLLSQARVTNVCMCVSVCVDGGRNHQANQASKVCVTLAIMRQKCPCLRHSLAYVCPFYLLQLHQLFSFGCCGQSCNFADHHTHSYTAKIFFVQVMWVGLRSIMGMELGSKNNFFSVRYVQAAFIRMNEAPCLNTSCIV